MFNFFSYAQAEGPVRDMMFDKIPVNIRTVNGIDLVSLKIKMGDMKSHGKPYEV